MDVPRDCLLKSVNFVFYLDMYIRAPPLCVGCKLEDKHVSDADCDGCGDDM